MLIEEIDGAPPATHPLAPYLGEAGFIAGALGYQARLLREPRMFAPPAREPVADA